MKWSPEKFGFKFEKFESPYPEGAPWPSMRGDVQNSGSFLQKDVSRQLQDESELVHFHTGNAVFSTPILDADERIYVGSGDHKFYCFDPHSQREVWSKEHSEIIDCAACIDKAGSIYVAGGDGQVHAYTPDGEELWTFNVSLNRTPQQFTFSTLYWYEGNIVVGPDGRSTSQTTTSSSIR
jgi:outer membrane protein assembly factor BamB